MFRWKANKKLITEQLQPTAGAFCIGGVTSVTVILSYVQTSLVHLLGSYLLLLLHAYKNLLYWSGGRYGREPRVVGPCVSGDARRLSFSEGYKNNE